MVVQLRQDVRPRLVDDYGTGLGLAGRHRFMRRSDLGKRRTGRQNQLTLWLHANDLAAYQKWNEIVQGHKTAVVTPLIEQTITPFKEVHRLPIALVHSVQWDVLGCAMENSYLGSGHKAFFFLELLMVYTRPAISRVVGLENGRRDHWGFSELWSWRRRMNGNPDGLRSLEKYSKLPVERIKYTPDADEMVIREIPRGILFLMAFWSGSSVTAFKQLTEVISRLDQNGTLELVVVDVDGSPALYQVPEFLGRVHGNGEAAWVRNGIIVTTKGPVAEMERFESNTASLLAMP